MRTTQNGSSERHETIESLTALLDLKKAEGASFIVRFSVNTHISLLKSQEKLIRVLNPGSIRLSEMNLTSQKERFIGLHRWPMKLWALISLCPHTYLMAISAIFGRLDLYMWYRVVVGNALFVVVLLWQRMATLKMLDELEVVGDRGLPARIGVAARKTL